MDEEDNARLRLIGREITNASIRACPEKSYSRAVLGVTSKAFKNKHQKKTLLGCCVRGITYTPHGFIEILSPE